MNDVKDRMQSGTVPDCLTVEALHNQQKIGMSDLFLAYSVSSPFGAGIETVRITRSRIIYCLTNRSDFWDVGYVYL